MSSTKDGDAQGSEQTACDTPAGTELEISSAKPKRPPTPRNCRNFIRKHTANAMPDIVNTFVDRAKGGSVPHFTSLAKMGGFDQRPVPFEAPKRRRKSLARQLLDEVEKYEARQAAELAAANASPAQGEGDPINSRDSQERA